ncbi:uncharacterized protein LAESUDRAFT_717306 [Laetiporus sulphureus 93-53]|uniref:Ribonuclease H1 N-terminal domain-containing protein n=1 Tax=Laetiporus sulphureus 93-53 TaxID=1314785 RepID=A0A165BV77_9APHY|nr:uncharacterized protein LAESUDRAFT_717306 [Laetiporus sulphureus 93-53]KZT01716.1 hypothetical protein LAESUDRAFT_717306 [Laetiporus sulphureus 93-53]
MTQCYILHYTSSLQKLADLDSFTGDLSPGKCKGGAAAALEPLVIISGSVVKQEQDKNEGLEALDKDIEGLWQFYAVKYSSASVILRGKVPRIYTEQPPVTLGAYKNPLPIVKELHVSHIAKMILGNYKVKYIVWCGVKTGIFLSWADCKPNAQNFLNADHQKEKNLDEAITLYISFQGHTMQVQTNKVPPWDTNTPQGAEESHLWDQWQTDTFTLMGMLLQVCAVAFFQKFAAKQGELLKMRNFSEAEGVGAQEHGKSSENVKDTLVAQAQMEDSIQTYSY